MAKVRLAKLDNTYIGRWRAQNRERATAIREQTLKAAKEGTPLAPIMRDQQEFIFSGVRRVWEELTEPSAEVLGQQILGVISGSYNRGNAVIGADLDLDFLYNHPFYRQLYPVERVIVESLVRLFDFPVAAIHPHLSFVLQAVFPQQESLRQPFALERAIVHWARERVPLGTKMSRFLMGLQQKYAVRDYQRISGFCLNKARGEDMPEEFDSYLNWGFAFGNEQRFKEFIAARDGYLAEAAEDPAVLNRENNLLLFRVSWNIEKASDLTQLKKATSSLKRFIKYLKKNALFYYIHLRRLEEYFGAEIITCAEDRKAAAAAIETLQKIRAAIYIEMFPDSQSVGPAYDSSPIPAAVLERVAGHLGCHSVDGLFSLILSQTSTVAQIVTDAQQAFFNHHVLGYNS